MTKHLDLNNEWLYGKTWKEGMQAADYPETQMEQVRIPHTNQELPFDYLDEKSYQFVSGYRYHLQSQPEWTGKQVLLTFDGVAHDACVYVNGKEAVQHHCGYTAFSVDIAPFLNPDGDNVIAVRVDSRESLNVPPFGYVIDYLTYGGIYREVSLEIREQVAIADAFVYTVEKPAGAQMDGKDTAGAQQSGSQWDVNLQLQISRFPEQGKYQVLYQLVPWKGSQVICQGEHLLDQAETKICFSVDGISRWELEDPQLYELQLQLVNTETGSQTDAKTIRFGFRVEEFRENGFYLNHKRVKLRGLNRHQSYPYVGYAMPKRMQELDAEILKYELQANAVRTSHYPQSHHFLNRCDELGLLVFTELPGWQHIGDEAWKKQACENVKEMVTQYRNHPSIILWGVRINESQDDDAFYTETNRIAHLLDPGRQTGGVRYLQKSHLLEDVYTYNDFLHNGTTPGIEQKAAVTPNPQAPYLVSEYNGHMFPTKSFDDEAHRQEHALRHCRVINGLYGQEGVAGGFAWCMFDYNTHKDFGSGDRICYHGVMDMFRNPKLAAAVYASQGEGKTVLEVSSALDIGEHPAGNLGKVYAFTNADSVRVYKNGIFVREFYPDRKDFPNMPHPPVLLDDFVGEMLETQEHYDHKMAETLKELLFAIRDYGQANLPLRCKLKMGRLLLQKKITMDEGMRLYGAYIANWGGEASSMRFEAIRYGEVAAVQEKAPAEHPVLEIQASCTQLQEGATYDAAEVRIRAKDQNGNTLPFYQEPITLKTWGSVSLIGPSCISLKGGMTGVYVKTNGTSGEGGLLIRQENLGEQKVVFQVK